MRLFIQPKKLLLVISVLFAIVTSAQKSVLTQHNNNDRTGWYDNETILNKSNVHSGSFGKIFVRPVDNQIYARDLAILHTQHANKSQNLQISKSRNNALVVIPSNAPYARIFQCATGCVFQAVYLLLHQVH